MRAALLLSLTSLALFLAPARPADATVVFQHEDDTDPTTEGWTEVIGSGVTGSEVTTGPVTGDGGFDAWFVDDDGPLANEFRWYEVSVPPSVEQRAVSNGWTLRARLRVVDVPDTPGGSPMVVYRDGTTSFQMVFGTDADGDPIVLLLESSNPVVGPSYTLEGTGGGYHLYELVYDPGSATADLFVDGVLQLSDYDGLAIAQSKVFFGAGSSADVGRGHFQLVELDVVPDVPALPLRALALAAILLGTCGALLVHRRISGS